MQTQSSFVQSSTFDLDDLLADVKSANDAHGISIRSMSEQMGVTYRALRYYESIGLIAPRHENGQRLFSNLDREKMELIVWGKRMGFSLAEIRLMIEEMRSHPGRHSVERLKRASIEHQLHRLVAKRDEIQAAIGELQGLIATTA
jgi:DNA-binding transcriptional MerR regulator